MYKSLNGSARLHTVFRAFGGIEQLAFDDAIDALGNSIVRRFVVFGHTNPGTQAVEISRVLIAAVLTASVRMMYQSGKVALTAITDSHLKCFQRVFGLQSIRDTPAQNLMRVAIRNHMQVTHTGLCINVCDIRRPQLICRLGNKATYKVLVFTEPVVRVGRTARFWPR